MMNHVLPGTLLLDPLVMDDPYSFYHDLHRHAPVWRVADSDVYAVGSYDLLAEACNRAADFSSSIRFLIYRDENGLPARLGFGDGGVNVLATSDPPVHAVHKKTVFPNFAVRRMSLIEPDVVAFTHHFVDEALRKPTLDFMADVANKIPINIISRLIGFRESNPDRLFQAALDSTEMLAGALSLAELQQLMQRSDDVFDWIARQLQVALREPDEDILTSIAHGVKEAEISAREGVVMLQTLLSAGGESTTSLMGNAVRILAENREVQHKVRANPDLIPSFVEEVLRIESPFRAHMRYVPKDTSLGGVTIHGGSTVLMMWGAANRDPEAFERSDDFILDRTRRHLGFGRGIHFCIGAPLARLEAKIVISALLARTRNISLDPGRTPKWVTSLLARRHQQLHLKIDRQ